MAMYRVCGRCGKKVEYGKQCDCSINYNKARYKRYNKVIRNREDNKEYGKFYSGKQWKVMRNAVATKYNGLCLKCLAQGKINRYNVIHHIVELREDMSKALDLNNLIPLCHGCHNDIHGNYTESKREELRRLLIDYNDKYC